MMGKVRDGMLSRKGIMIFGRSLLTVALVSVLTQAAFAADPQQTYLHSTDALYNLDFSIAQQGFEGLTREYPDNPD